MHDCTSLRSENGLLLKCQHNCPSWSLVYLGVVLHFQHFFLFVSPRAWKSSHGNFLNSKATSLQSFWRKWQVLGVTGVLLPKSENLGPNAFCSSLHFTLEHFNCTAFQWKMLSRPKFANQREFSNKDRASESLGRLRLILRLIGEWRDAAANPCLVAYQQKGLVSLFLSSLCLGIFPPRLSIRKGIIPHSTCIRKK